MKVKNWKWKKMTERDEDKNGYNTDNTDINLN